MDLPLERRLEMAKDPRTPEEVLERLARDENEDVQWAVAYNFNTPTDTLQWLACFSDWPVRVAAGWELEDRGCTGRKVPEE